MALIVKPDVFFLPIAVICLISFAPTGATMVEHTIDGIPTEAVHACIFPEFKFQSIRVFVCSENLEKLLPCFLNAIPSPETRTTIRQALAPLISGDNDRTYCRHQANGNVFSSETLVNFVGNSDIINQILATLRRSHQPTDQQRIDIVPIASPLGQPSFLGTSIVDSAGINSVPRASLQDL